MKERLKSKVVWVTAIPVIAKLIATFFGLDLAGQFEDVATQIILLLAIFGILNNPTDPDNF